MAFLTKFSALKSLGNPFISSLFPNQCLVCSGGESHSPDPLCPECINALHPIRLENRADALTVRDNIDFAYTGWNFTEELRTTVHSLKYEDRAKIGAFLGRELGRRFEHQSRVNLDLIVPVPLHPVKFQERGYNQAEWIAKGLGDALDIPVKNDLVKRVRYTNTQTALNQAERLENMKQAFKIAGSVMGLALGIVDDVLTTGSTLSSMAAVLKYSGAVSICALTIATPLEQKNDSNTESI